MHHRSGSWVKGHYRNGTWVSGHNRKSAYVSDYTKNIYSRQIISYSKNTIGIQSLSNEDEAKRYIEKDAKRILINLDLIYGEYYQHFYQDWEEKIAIAANRIQKEKKELKEKKQLEQEEEARNKRIKDNNNRKMLARIKSLMKIK